MCFLSSAHSWYFYLKRAASSKPRWDVLCVREKPQTLGQWWTHLSCAPLVYKSLHLVAHQKHFSPPLAQWYIHASSHYSEIWSITLLEPTTMQPKILCFVCYHLLKKKKNNAFSSDLSVATDGQIPAVPCSSSSIYVSICRAGVFPGVWAPRGFCP